MYGSRLKLLRDRFESMNLDALLVTSLPNIYYLSGFTGSTAMLFITQDKCYFITDGRYTIRVQQEVDKAYQFVDNTGKNLVREVLPNIIGGQAVKRIGFEAVVVTQAQLKSWSEQENWSFIPTSNWVEDIRQVKSEAEIELLRQSTLMNERLFEEVLGFISDDITERDLAAEIYYRSLKIGAQGVSFDPIIASGEHSAMPHAGYTGEKLVPGAPLTIDMGVKLNGYCSDMTRTVFFKDCPAEWEAIYTIVKQAKDAAFDAVKPGMKGCEVDSVARKIITDAGYGDKFGHSLGHGVGVQVHEGPRLASVYEKEIVAGNVVSNEPGIYLPGKGGVRIEDLMVIRENGAESLNTLATDIRVVG